MRQTIIIIILDAQHSGDGVTLLVGLQHLSLTFRSDMQSNSVVMFVSYGATPMVCVICRSTLYASDKYLVYWVKRFPTLECLIQKVLRGN